MSQKIHLICGLPGAGKTTYAEQLRLDLKAVRFSIDDWNDRLFFMDRDPTSDFNWFYDRVQRCCSQMRDTAEQVIATGHAVIFDCGLTNRQERQIFYDWADNHGFSTSLHFLDVDPDTRWSRVSLRNAEQGTTYRIEVTRDMFDFMHTIWEAPDSDEMGQRNGHHITD